MLSYNEYVQEDLKFIQKFLLNF